MNAATYAEHISHVNDLVASLRSAKDNERRAEMHRLVLANDRLIAAKLARKNAALSARASAAIYAAYTAIQEALA